MKRILSLFLAALMVLNIGCITVFADPAAIGFSVAASADAVSVGDTVTACVSVGSHSSLAGFTIKLSYDPTKLTLSSAEKGSGLSGGAEALGAETLIYTAANSAGYTGDGGVLFSAVFTAASAGEAEFSLSFVEGDTPVDTAGAGITPSLTGDLVTIAGASTPDNTTAPVISLASPSRTGAETASVSLTTDEAGAAYYALTAVDVAEAPTIDATGTGAAVNGTSTLEISGITGNDAVKLWAVVKDAAGNVSDAASCELPAYAPAEESAPVISLASPSRTGADYASVSLTTDKAGSAYYAITAADVTEAPAIATEGAGVPVEAGTASLAVSGFQNGDACKVWVAVKSAAGKVSAAASASFEAYAYKTVEVTFGAYDGRNAAFMMLPQAITVTEGTAAKYGFGNAAPGTLVGGVDHGVPAGGITVLDAIFAAHEVKYGAAFTSDTASNYMSGMAAGNITKMFGSDRGQSIGFAVNDRPPIGEKSDGYSVKECVLKANDNVMFYIYGGEYGMEDYFSYFDQKKASVESGVPLTLTLTGYEAMEQLMGSPGPDTKELTTLGPIEGAQIVLIDENGGVIADSLAGGGILTDAEGKFTYSFPQPGTYRVSAIGAVYSGTWYDDVPIVAPFCEVTVTGNYAPNVKDGVEDASIEIAAVSGAYNPGITGKFEDRDGDALTYHYRYKLGDGEFGGWTPVASSDIMFSGPAYFEIIQSVPGVYTYEFKANDGKADSVDVYTVTATVYDPETKEYSITIKLAPSTASLELYKTTGFDANGADTYDSESPITLTDGGVVGGYHVYTAAVRQGAYSYRAVDGGVSIGGMTFDIPLKTAGNAGSDSTTVTLRRTNFYATTKLDGANFANGDQYYVKATDDDGKLVTMGEAYKSGNYWYYPAVLFAGGNAELYSFEFTPAGEYAATFATTYLTNQTVAAGTSALTKSAAMYPLVGYTITAPTGASVKVFNQLRNYLAMEIASSGSSDNGDGTAAWSFSLPSTGNLTYRVSMDGKITKAGYISSSAGAATVTFGKRENPKYRGTYEGNSSALNGVAEDSILLNVNEDNYMTMETGETFRLRAYRAPWEIVNTVVGNVMIEPDFHYTVKEGSDVVSVTPVTSGNGNATGNWMDITALKAGVAVIEVTYDAIDITGGSYDGRYSAIDPKRVGTVVIQVGAAGSLNMDWGIAASGSDGSWDSELDTAYFFKGAAGFEFTPTAHNGTVEKAYLNGAELSGSDGKYTANLTAGTNILKVTGGGRSAYKMIRANQISYSLTKTAGDPSDTAIRAGDTISLSFTGLDTPIPKLAGIYNPTGTKINYTIAATGGKLQSAGAQYSFLSSPATTLTVTEDMLADGKLTLTEGKLTLSMFCDAGLMHRGIGDSGLSANFTAVMLSKELCIMPDITIDVNGQLTYDITLAGLPEDAVITFKNAAGDVIAASAENRLLFEALAYDSYSYEITAAGKKTLRGSFAVSEKAGEGTRTITLAMEDMISGGWDGTAATEPAKVTSEESNTAGGDFEGEEGYYKITSGAELAWISAEAAKGTAGLNAVLANDIDLSGFRWTPIGTQADPFSSVLDGNGKTISGLYVESSDRYTGLFGYMNGAAVKDLAVSGAVNAEAMYAGGIAGYAVNETTFTNVVSDVDVSMTNKSTTTAGKRNRNYAGGIAGAGGAAYTSCSFTGTIKNAYQYAGGLVGSASSAEFSGCVNSGDIEGYQYVGGIVGDASASSFTGCTNSGSAAVQNSGGGIAGQAGAGSAFSACVNSGDIIGTPAGSSDNLGGIAGYTTGKADITDCSNSGSVSGRTSIGGLVGQFKSGGAAAYGTLSFSYNTGAVTGGGNNVGGLVGYNYGGVIENAYNTGAVANTAAGAGSTGGIAGTSFASTAAAYTNTRIENVYNTGRIDTASTAAGAVVGDDVGAANITAPIVNAHYLSGTHASATGDADGDPAVQAARQSASYMKGAGFVNELGIAFERDTAGKNGRYPVLKQSAAAGDEDAASAPVISSVTLDPTEPTSGPVTITVNAEDNCRISGCSFDGGESWQAGNTKAYSANTTIAADAIMVKDPAGNITSYASEIVIGNIDTAAPAMTGLAVSRPSLSGTDGRLSFTASEGGTLYYMTAAADADAPEASDIAAEGAAAPAAEGENTLNVRRLYSKQGALKLYAVIKDPAGNLSAAASSELEKLADVTIGIYDYTAVTAGTPGASAAGVILPKTKVTVPDGATVAAALTKLFEVKGELGGVVSTGGLGSYLSKVGSLENNWFVGCTPNGGAFDDFTGLGIDLTTLSEGDSVSVHWSAQSGYEGTGYDKYWSDVGSFWGASPKVLSFSIDGNSGVISADGKAGTELDPYEISVAADALTGRSAVITTNLHEAYRVLSPNVLSACDYSDGLLFSVSNLGGHSVTWYRVTVTAAQIVPETRSLTLYNGGSSELKAAWSDGAARPITWEIVSGADFVSVEGASITALAEGKAVLKASGALGQSTLVNVTVLPAPISEAVLSHVYVSAAFAEINLAATGRSTGFTLTYVMSDGTLRYALGDIESVTFNNAKAGFITASVTGDRLELSAGDGAKAGTYKGTATIKTSGAEFVTPALTLKVINKAPTVKASADAINIFYTDAGAALKVTASYESVKNAAVESSCVSAASDIFDYADGLLTFKGAAAKGTYKVPLTVTIDGYKPVSTTVSVKAAYAAPKAATAPKSVKLINEAGRYAEMSVVPSSRGAAYSDLRVASVELAGDANARTYKYQDCFAVEGFNAHDGTFRLSLVSPIEARSAKALLRVSFVNGSGTVELPVTVSIATLSVKLAKSSVTLNSAMGAGVDTAKVAVSAAPAGEEALVTDVRLLSGKTESALTALDWSFEEGALCIKTNSGTAAGRYTLAVYAEGVAKALRLTVTVNGKAPALTASASGKMDVLNAQSTIKVTPKLSPCALDIADLMNSGNVSVVDENGNEHAVLKVVSASDGVVTLGWKNWDGSAIPLTKISYGLLLTVGGETYALKKPLSLTPVQGGAKVSASGTAQLYSSSPYAIGTFSLSTSLGRISSVSIKDAEKSGYELYNYGGGLYGIGFKDNALPARYRASDSVKLVVGLAGGPKTLTVTVKLAIAK